MAAHSLLVYDQVSVLLESVSETIAPAIRNGGAAVVIATPAHRAALAELLALEGIDISSAMQEHRYIAVDAQETLDRFYQDGTLDRDAFQTVILDLLRQAASPRPVAFGEMVALLAMRGERSQAIELERYWNEALKAHALDLLCAYHTSDVQRAESEAPDEVFLDQVHAVHTLAVRAPSRCGVPGPIDVMKAIIASAPARSHPCAFYEEVAEEFGLTADDVARGLLVMEATGEAIRDEDDYWRAAPR